MLYYFYNCMADTRASNYVFQFFDKQEAWMLSKFMGEQVITLRVRMVNVKKEYEEVNEEDEVAGPHPVHDERRRRGHR